MKKCKSLAALLLGLLLSAALCPMQAMAAGSIDLNRDASLTITEKYGEQPLSGVRFELYLVSTVDETGELTPAPAFEKYAAELDIRGQNDSAWQALAEKLDRELLLGNLGLLLPADSAVTGEQGRASFPSPGRKLTLGLYLVPGTRTEKEGYVYSTAPFFVLLPEQDAQSNTWNYAPAAQAKPGQSPVLADYEVIKIWKDDCHKDQRPQSITVQLLCDGEVYDTITLPQNGAWKYTWQDLDTNHVWTVTETKLPGYQEPAVQREGNTFIVTNTCSKPGTPVEPGKPILPQTGQLWWPVPALLAAGLLFVVIGLIRRRGERHES